MKGLQTKMFLRKFSAGKQFNFVSPVFTSICINSSATRINHTGDNLQRYSGGQQWNRKLYKMSSSSSVVQQNHQAETFLMQQNNNTNRSINNSNVQHQQVHCMHGHVLSNSVSIEMQKNCSNFCNSCKISNQKLHMSAKNELKMGDEKMIAGNLEKEISVDGKSNLKSSAMMFDQQQINKFSTDLVEKKKLDELSGTLSRVLTMENLNPNVINIEYAVRGPIVARAAEIEKELERGVKKPFKQVIRANIGDCHACGQRPLTFLRQVVALCTYPDLMNSLDFNDDAKSRARQVLSGCRGNSIGSYSDSIGIEIIREHIAAYITERDGGIPSNAEDIFLSTGASDAIKAIMRLLVTGRDSPKAGIMVPVPVYPLYTAILSEFNSYPILYYLNEEGNWSLDSKELKRSIEEAREHCIPRGIVVINPGNPTGQVLTKENIQLIIKFAKEENILLMADEVYQHNVYAKGAEFHSFKKVMTDMGGEYKDMELASFMSTSKGYMGECGYRGGYCELINMDPEVKHHLIKSLSAKLCPSVSGQAAMDVVANPPKPGEPSYALYKKEKDIVLGELKEKAHLTSKLLNSIPGVSCQEVQGAMYAFPSIILPSQFIQEAKLKNMVPDALYCTYLLEETGICVVPGSGFGQKPGTFHFRMTILPPVPELKDLLKLFAEFQQRFLEEYK